ncbi:hypothetical protein [Nocardia testacea]|uniref:hypothetical protein n=1 Tax=Nocardia testacea TaxID=248551 RepID=UPI003A86C5CD
MSDRPAQREPNPIVTRAASQLRSRRGRRDHTDLHTPNPEQLTLFEPPEPENRK